MNTGKLGSQQYMAGSMLVLPCVKYVITHTLLRTRHEVPTCPFVSVSDLKSWIRVSEWGEGIDHKQQVKCRELIMERARHTG